MRARVHDCRRGSLGVDVRYHELVEVLSSAGPCFLLWLVLCLYASTSPPLGFTGLALAESES